MLPDGEDFGDIFDVRRMIFENLSPQVSMQAARLGSLLLP